MTIVLMFFLITFLFSLGLTIYNMVMNKHFRKPKESNVLSSSSVNNSYQYHITFDNRRTESMICPRCNTYNPPGTVYCYHCGEGMYDASGEPAIMYHLKHARHWTNYYFMQQRKVGELRTKISELNDPNRYRWFSIIGIIFGLCVLLLSFAFEDEARYTVMVIALSIAIIGFFVRFIISSRSKDEAEEVRIQLVNEEDLLNTIRANYNKIWPEINPHYLTPEATDVMVRIASYGICNTMGELYEKTDAELFKLKMGQNMNTVINNQYYHNQMEEAKLQEISDKLTKLSEKDNYTYIM